MDTEPETSAPLVLLIEDDVSLREALAFALRIEGYKVEEHERAASLLDSGDLSGAACLVLDHFLPGLTGIEALEAARRQGLRCPAILITTQPKPDVRAAAERLGARILEKPLLGGELPAVIRELLRTAS